MQSLMTMHDIFNTHDLSVDTVDSKVAQAPIISLGYSSLRNHTRII